MRLRYNNFQAEATLQYSTDMFSQSSIVSSIDFDCDADYFAVAGVTKKIKIYDYQRVVNRSINQVHSPTMEMTCQSKISCVAWNKYHKVGTNFWWKISEIFINFGNGRVWQRWKLVV